MSLTMPANEGGSYERCPEGNHFAVCTSIIDLGTQVEKYAGQPDKEQRKVYISWEIAGETREDGKPFYVGKRYTLSSYEKANLRKDLESWRGIKFLDSDFGPGGFELKNVLGKGCMLNVVHSEKDGKTYANIATIARLPKGASSPQPTEPPVYFSLEPDEFSATAYEEVSDRLKETIVKSPEYAALQNIAVVNEGYARTSHVPASYSDDDIPF
jgi:hypothetical protein